MGGTGSARFTLPVPVIVTVGLLPAWERDGLPGERLRDVVEALGVQRPQFLKARMGFAVKLGRKPARHKCVPEHVVFDSVRRSDLHGGHRHTISTARSRPIDDQPPPHRSTSHTPRRPAFNIRVPQTIQNP